MVSKVKIFVMAIALVMSAVWFFSHGFDAGATSTHLTLSAPFVRQVLETPPEAPFELRFFTTAVKTDSRGLHYHEFLNREPDASGLGFWTNQMKECGTDVRCLELRRINVSAAFFLSIEFQQTGYLVNRFYRATFGRRPLMVEFLPDTRKQDAASWSEPPGGRNNSKPTNAPSPTSG